LEYQIPSVVVYAVTMGDRTRVVQIPDPIDSLGQHKPSLPSPVVTGIVVPISEHPAGLVVLYQEMPELQVSMATSFVLLYVVGGYG
jgi:hypothetical protein